mmetsp:Transcript_35683/g.71546  ORF Transcript_35683/g.71546 Transcript_35683/m.71546 type:complete len:228 (+) Transcript_35683:1312-1995(+)
MRRAAVLVASALRPVRPPPARAQHAPVSRHALAVRPARCPVRLVVSADAHAAVALAAVGCCRARPALAPRLDAEPRDCARLLTLGEACAGLTRVVGCARPSQQPLPAPPLHASVGRGAETVQPALGPVGQTRAQARTALAALAVCVLHAHAACCGLSWLLHDDRSKGVLLLIFLLLGACVARIPSCFIDFVTQLQVCVACDVRLDAGPPPVRSGAQRELRATKPLVA